MARSRPANEHKKTPAPKYQAMSRPLRRRGSKGPKKEKGVAVAVGLPKSNYKSLTVPRRDTPALPLRHATPRHATPRHGEKPVPEAKKEGVPFVMTFRLFLVGLQPHDRYRCDALVDAARRHVDSGESQKSVNRGVLDVGAVRTRTATEEVGVLLKRRFRNPVKSSFKKREMLDGRTQRARRTGQTDTISTHKKEDEADAVGVGAALR
ncbi:hypothetical protein B0H16DRAFT_1779206 [Mycena metata]|uniref:Uncharacterized protein n=1 Tax=Mycena metata TaxID=1033252 RepID=A0AAD7JSE8_9AGAR|nr:hypothetical protein B0H16DRAFT_1779206 [Mycena metata]